MKKSHSFFNHSILTLSIPLIVFYILLVSLEALGQHAHPDDPHKEEEHQAAMNLTPVAEATHTAISNGLWTNSATWNTNSVPGANAKVVIPHDITVTYNSTSNVSLSWIRVEGIMQYATDQSTSLTVETIIVTPTGLYEQGTVSSPIPATFTSIITFADNGEITDQLKLGRGLISHGKVQIHGAPVTPFLKTTHAISAGATQLTLKSVPINWKVGDKVGISGMRLTNGSPAAKPQDELKTITAISGSTITLESGLINQRKVDFPQWDLYPYVANTTRNIQYKSANVATTRRGHIMFMHNPNVDVRWAGFYDLGRTRKDITVTDSRTSALPTGTNPRGKYAFHFHRTGHQNINIAPAYVQGCAVVNTPGWAYVNHDSYVNFEDNVSYNAQGAHFVTENGAERGGFRRNIAMRATGGSQRHIKDGLDTHDLAHGGHGFWFQGGNIIAEDNVATGCAEGGLVWFERSSNAHNSDPNQFIKTEFLIDPEVAAGRPGLAADEVPIMSHKNNTAYACFHGMIAIDIELNGEGPGNSMIENFNSLNAMGPASILLEYYRNFTFKDCKVLRDNDFKGNIYDGKYAFEAHNLIDHIYPLETRSADRAINVIVRNHMYGVHNYLNDNNDGEMEAVDKSKWQLVGSGIDHDGPSPTFTGPQLVETIADETAVIPFPSFSPAAGTYASSQMVTITSVPGATIYYVIGSQQWQTPTLEYQLKTGKWIRYTGPVSVSQNRRLIAVAVKDGQYSRPRCGYYYINPNAGTQASAPTLTPAPGTYSSAQTVTLRTATTGAQIRYTLDGSMPSSTTGILISSNTGTVHIHSSSTIRAIAFGSGMTNSTITTGAYTINALVQAAAPTFTPTPGTYPTAQTITLSTATTGAHIRYTLDGTAPTSTTGTLISSNTDTVHIHSSSTIRAIAFGSGMASSAITTGEYTINASVQVAAPTFTPAPGTYSTPQTITLSTATTGAQIRYTLDGTAPTSTTGTLISSSSGTVLLNSTSTVSAIAFGTGMQNSSIATGAYTIIPSSVQSPFSGSPIMLPGIFEVENFDTGGEGVAYHDTEIANRGRAHRPTDGVDIETCSEGGFNIGWIQNGEWLEYTINVQTPGSYNLEARVASPSGGGIFEVLFSNGNVTTGDITVPATGGWQTWASLTRTGLALNAGVQTLRINFKSAGFNINQIRITAPDTQSPSIPGGLVSSNVTPTSFTLSWNVSTDNVGVVGYNVYRDGFQIGTPNTTSYNVTGLTAGTTHNMTVTARDATGNQSALSSTLPVTTLSNDQAGYRYLRYTVLSTNGNYKVVELDWMVGSTQYPSVNLSSNSSGGMVVSGNGNTGSFRAFDGIATDANGLWVGTQIPYQITLDLGSNSISPTGIRIQKSSFHGLNSFRCEGSNNNTTWTTLFESSNAQGTWTDQTFNFSSGATARISAAAKESTSSLAGTTSTEPVLSTFPNPANELLLINYNADSDKNVVIKMIDLNNRQLVSKAFPVKKGHNLISLSVSELGNGMYLLLVDNIFQRIIIEK